MARPDDLVAYTYRADIYCADDIFGAVIPDQYVRMGFLQRIGTGMFNTPESVLDRLADARGIDRADERSFDSGTFPKVVFRDQLEPDDRCARCGELLDQ